MTLYTIVNILKQIALTQPNVNSATDGSIYDIMNATNSVKYDVVHFSQTKHISDEERDTYGFNIFYVSRLEDSLEDNRLQIQSIGKEVLDNILRTFCENWGVDYPEIIFYPFTQKFADLCAGCYCKVDIEVPKEIICADDYTAEVVPGTGIKLQNVTVNINQNGLRVITPAAEYDGIGEVTIVTDVPQTAAVLQYKEVEYTENGDYTVTPDAGYDGLSDVAISINVASGGGYDEGYEDGVADQKAKLSTTSVTENGTYTREDGYSAITVDVPQGQGYEEGYEDGVADQKAKLITTAVTENGTYTREDGYSAFSVNVDDRYDEGYDDGEAAQKAKLTITSFTQNDTYTRTDGWSSVTVNVDDRYDDGYDDGYRDGTAACSGLIISSLTLVVDSVIEDTGVATTYYRPTTAYTDLHYSTSDPTKAIIDEIDGIITVISDGTVTFCVTDRISGLKSCQTVAVRKSGVVGPFEVIYDVTSTTDPTQIMESYGRAALSFDYFTYDGVDYPVTRDTTGFTFPTVGRHTVSYHLTTPIVDMAFWGCDRLVEAHIPSYVAAFDSTFVKTSLSAVTLNEGLIRVWDAFRETDLISVILPNSLLSIDESTFAECHSLVNVTVGNNVCFVGDNAFKDSEHLTGVTFPASLGNPASPTPRIGEFAFSGCTGLRHLTFLSETPALLEGEDNSLGSTEYSFPIYVPSQSVDLYKSKWYSYRDRIMEIMPLPLTFKIIEAGNIYWLASNSSYAKTIEYRKNNGVWTSITSNTGASAPSISVNEGDTIQFRGDNATYASNSYSYNTFSGSTAKFEVEGNIMSLIDSENFNTATTLASSYTFNSLFSYCTGLTSAENLTLPATTLAINCYSSMFGGCTSLTQAPALPATTLVDNCYRAMFYGCTSLAYIKCLATDISASNCTTNWVLNVVPTGTFVKDVNMSSWGTGDSGIPRNWTIVDNS